MEIYDGSVRVRFAPSPTGYLHIGGLRTALYNFLFARKHQGQFILRIEDTDQERYVEGAEQDILDSLEWAGLTFDEGPGRGPHQPYRQSERSETYHKYASELIDSGHAYIAFDTPEEIEAMKTRLQQGGNAAPKYDVSTRSSMKNSLTLPEEEVRRRIGSGEEYVVRLKIPKGETVRFEDLIRGWVAFDTSGLDDQVLIKSDGMPTYHLANVVDDHLMAITHVIRGEEWLSSTPKHILLYRFFEWTPPRMAHLPLILSPEGGKLSKRNADKIGIPVAVRQYREQGYEPNALVNFLAFLGWNPGTEQEVFTLEELIDAFTVGRIGSSGVQFNMDKLRWYNQQFIRRMSVDELVSRTRPIIHKHGYRVDDLYMRKVVAVMRERLTLAEDIVTECPYFFSRPERFEETGVKKRWKEDSASLLVQFADRLEQTPDFSAELCEQELRSVADENGVGAGRIIHPVRLALTGVTHGPGLFELMVVLGRKECIKRLRKAVEILG